MSDQKKFSPEESIERLYDYFYKSLDVEPTDLDLQYYNDIKNIKKEHEDLHLQLATRNNLLELAVKLNEDMKKKNEELKVELEEARNVARQLNDWLTNGSPDDKALNIKRELTQSQVLMAGGTNAPKEMIDNLKEQDKLQHDADMPEDCSACLACVKSGHPNMKKEDKYCPDCGII